MIGDQTLAVIALIVLTGALVLVGLYDWAVESITRRLEGRERKEPKENAAAEETPARKDLEQLAVERLEEANFWAYDGREQLPISNEDIQKEIAKIRSEKGNRPLRLE